MGQDQVPPRLRPNSQHPKNQRWRSLQDLTGEPQAWVQDARRKQKQAQPDAFEEESKKACQVKIE